MRIAVVGGGWAGLAGAVEAAARGHDVTLYEMARRPGGRARRVDGEAPALDNGQHILIGAYTETLRLMALVGADAERLLWRKPLTLAYADGAALALPAGEPRLAFARAVLGRRGWRWRDRWRLLLRRGRLGARRLSLRRRDSPSPNSRATFPPRCAPT